MQARRRERLERERQELVQELTGLGHMIRGSLVHSGKTCGNKGCQCHKGQRHPYTAISTHRGGRSHLVYVRQAVEPQAQAAVDAYRRAWQVIEELSRINVELFTAGPEAGEEAGQ
jgi:hypothetical protein